MIDYTAKCAGKLKKGIYKVPLESKTQIRNKAMIKAKINKSQKKASGPIYPAHFKKLPF